MERRFVGDSKGNGNQMMGYKVEFEECSGDGTEMSNRSSLAG